ncbi:MAG: FAD-dependent oxidoreductase [Planctomycetota bacterium]|nr:FAD-dependent oxidoreductase [Planctomycetota bacterium]
MLSARARSLLLAALLGACSTAPPAVETHDVVVYGCTSAGVMAAVQAHRMGKSVVLVGPDTHLGGLSASGLGWTDSGNKAVIGGLAREFYGRIYTRYTRDDAWRWQRRGDYGNRGQGTPAIDGDARTMWTFEPHVAEAVFEALVAEHRLEVHRDAWLDRTAGVEVVDGRIRSITTLAGARFAGDVFIDATYEGDLMAAAGVSYTVGRESNDTYGETLNGVQAGRARSHQFDRPVDPYVVPGDPSSGLLPRIHAGPPGEEGAGDHRVQAYCFRTCMTDHPDNKVPWPKPAGYDPSQYELLLRHLLAGWKGTYRKFDPIPNRKTDTNNHGAFSFDNIGANYAYPEGTYAERRAIVNEHRTYQQGLLWFLANDPRVPSDIQAQIRRWGLAADEFVDNDNWPHQIYVREARRMVSDWVQTERHLRRQLPTPRPIGMGSYNMDSHNVQRYVDADGYARNEGDIQISPGGPYPVDYGAIIPRRDECENLLVPVCLSSSHIAYGSIRMEPVFMILGQSAATAAAIALDCDCAVQDVDYSALAARLTADGQVLRAAEDVGAKYVQLAEIPGVVVDDTAAELTGPWRPSGMRRGVHRGYLHDDARGDGACRGTLRTKLDPGRYRVGLGYVEHANRAANVPVEVRCGDQVHRYTVDQRRRPNDGAFYVLDELRLAGPVSVIVTNEGADGFVILDAVRFTLLR